VYKAGRDMYVDKNLNSDPDAMCMIRSYGESPSHSVIAEEY
jgi:hypothetical protein